MARGLPATPKDAEASMVIELQNPIDCGAFTDTVTPTGRVGAATMKLVTELPPHEEKSFHPSKIVIGIIITERGTAVAADPNERINVVLEINVH